MVPILTTLIEQADSTWVREGVHHVLHDMNQGNLREILQPVLAALEGNNPALEVPLAAQAALAVLKNASTDDMHILSRGFNFISISGKE